MPTLLTDPIMQLYALFAASPTRLMIGLVGVPGAGKTTLAAQWATHLNAAHGAGTAVALGMDGFHLTKAQLTQFADPVAAFVRRGAPWTFDAAGFVAALQNVRRAGGVAAASWPGLRGSQLLGLDRAWLRVRVGDAPRLPADSACGRRLWPGAASHE